MVTLQNYEEYIMLYVDEELDTASEKELMLFLEKHPELKKELALYQKTKLSPASELVFAGKDQLIKPPARKIQLNRWLLYAVAASVVLLIALVTGKWMNAPVEMTTDLPQVAVKHTDSVAYVPQVVAKTDSADQPSLPAVQPAKKNNPSSLAATQKAPARKKVITPDVNQQPATPAPKNPVPYENEEQPIAQTDDQTAEESKEPVQEISQPLEKRKKKRGLLALLPISNEKKEGLNHLKNTMQNKVETVKSIQEELKNTSLEVKLGNKELFVINL